MPYIRCMKRIVLIFALAMPLPASAQDAAPENEGPSLMERGARMFFRGLMEDVDPALESLRDLAEDAGAEIVIPIAANAWPSGPVADGAFDAPQLFQIVLGVPWGAPSTPEAMVFMRNLLPPGANWAGFGIGRAEFPFVALAAMLGGHCRVGLEDNLYLEKGVLAPSNAALVEKAVRVLEVTGATVATSAQAREILGLRGRP